MKVSASAYQSPSVPNPPALLTADASAGPTSPPIGAWIMGTSIPTRVQRVVFMQRTPKSSNMLNNRMPPFNHCRVGESERVVSFRVVHPLLALRVISHCPLAIGGHSARFVRAPRNPCTKLGSAVVHPWCPNRARSRKSRASSWRFVR